MPRTGSTSERGYDAEHQRLRAEGIEAAYGTPCWRCGEIMHRWQDLDLGHDDDDRTRYRGFEHASCNRGAGAAKGNRQRGQRVRRVRRQLSVSVHDL